MTLGKISNVKFGFTGKNKSEFGFEILYQMGDVEYGSYWGLPLEYTFGVDYSEQMYDYYILRNYREIQELMLKAKVEDFNDLVGIPIEIIEDKDSPRTIRILTEVL